jgi:hypothetical protein
VPSATSSARTTRRDAASPGARWRWIYAGNPHGRALTWLALDDRSGEVAGLTSFFRRRMVAGGREVRGALGGDGYVRPAFRRRGLGELLHRASRRDMAALGIDLMFGTPLPANFTPLRKAGARTIGDTRRFARPLGERLYRLLPAALGRGLAALVDRPRAGLELSPVVEADARVESVWEATRPEIDVATVRDAEFYAWRFLRSPSGRQQPFVVLDGGRPIAACALERVGDRMRIVDLLAPARHWAPALRAIADRARGCVVAEMQLTEHEGRARRMWLHAYVPRDPVPVPLNILLPEGEPGADVYYDARRWFVTWAETDLDHV